VFTIVDNQNPEDVKMEITLRDANEIIGMAYELGLHTPLLSEEQQVIDKIKAAFLPYDLR